jgi:predicted RNA methylase
MELEREVMDVLRGCTVDGNVLKLPDVQLDRKLYQRVDKALGAIGAKWNRKAGGHVLGDEESTERLRVLLADGRLEPIDNLGYFPTPPALVDRLLEHAVVLSHHTVLEPSVGRGAISERLLETVSPAQLWAVELQPKHANTLDPARYPNLIVGGFLETTFPCQFDRIVMNPPFERQQDIDHITYAFSLLAPGGRLVAIAGSTAATGAREKNRAFRELIEAHGFSEPNPDGAFKASGTNVSTVTVVLDAPTQHEETP